MSERRRLFGRFRRRPAPGLTCREVVSIVTDYLEGALSPTDAARVEAHLAGCDGCATYLEQMRQTIALLGRLPEDSLSPEAERTLLEAFQTWGA
jgi:anti-sigma factor RsiW